MTTVRTRRVLNTQTLVYVEPAQYRNPLMTLQSLGSKNMAFYIEMDKLADTEEYVEYSFGRRTDIGILRLNKVRGTLTVLSECPLDQAGEWSQRAAMKLARLWKDGVYPDKTQWAS